MFCDSCKWYKTERIEWEGWDGQGAVDYAKVCTLLPGEGECPIQPPDKFPLDDPYSPEQDMWNKGLI